MSVSQLYVSLINSYKCDCDQLLKSFKERDSADFRVFVDVWKSFKFSLIYEKYKKYGYLQEFKEDSLQLAKMYMLNDDFVGGLYLIYGLYYVQSSPKVSVRLELGELNRILGQIQEIRDNLTLTCMPGYIFCKLLANNAFAFVAFAREFSMEGMYRARLIHGEEDYFSTAMPLKDQKKVHAQDWLQSLLNKYNFDRDELKTIDEKYLDYISKLKEDHPELNLSLGMAPQNVIQYVEDHLMDVEDALMTGEKSTTSDIGYRRQSLKHRRRHVSHRYEKNGETSGNIKVEPTANPCKKAKGAPKGVRKTFVLKAINSPSESECDYSDADTEDSKPSLFTIN